jgi:hypothetical protein
MSSELVYALTNIFFSSLLLLLIDNIPTSLIPIFLTISEAEIIHLPSKSSITSCLGLDSISYKIWKAIHHHSPALISYIIITYLNSSLNPLAQHDSNGIVLSNCENINYDSAKSFPLLYFLILFQ